MRKLLIVFISISAVLSCTRDKAVEVKALFSTNKDVYRVAEEIIVTNESTVTNDILAFCKWTYGDEEAPSHAYTLELEGVSFSVPGDYIISLTAYAEEGAGKDTYTRKIKVISENDVPWADFDCPAVIKVGEEIVLEDKSVDNVGGIESWLWEVGDEKLTYQSPRISFDKPAAGLEIKLTVVDVYGASGSVKKLVDVVE